MSVQHPQPVSLTAAAGAAAGVGFAAVAYGAWVIRAAAVVLALVLWRRPGWRCRLLAAARLAGRLAREIAFGRPTPPEGGPGPAGRSVPAARQQQPVPDVLADPADVARIRSAIDEVFSTFGVGARVDGWVRGPAVTRYEVVIGAGVRINAVSQLVPNISYATGCGQIRVLAPIPGRSAIGLELPNAHREVIGLADVLGRPELAGSADPLRIVAGVGLDGSTVTASLGKLPHLLIAGATGAGKSSAINSVLCTLLHRATPAQLRLLLIDPKRVELAAYAGVPHLVRPIVTSPREAVAALDWLTAEMDRRYDVLAAAGARDITTYNSRTASAGGRPLPFLVAVVDEMADLMLLAKAEAETAIVRLTQLARAAGIHLILATQRPSVNVVTGLIKANTPSRWAFAVASGTDSRTILDQNGAETLLGAGDSLWLPIGAAAPIRLQGVWVSDADIAAAVAAAVAHGPAETNTHSASISQPATPGGPGTGDEDAGLLRLATELVVTAQLASASMLQRKLRIGYARAARLIDQLETAGIVGPATGTTKARDVLITSMEGLP